LEKLPEEQKTAGKITIPAVFPASGIKDKKEQEY